MNAHFLIWEQGWQTAGWTMVYYLALGSLVALLAAALRWILRGADPALRYATSLAVFAALALMPVGIAVWLSQTPASEFPLTELVPAPAPQVVDLAITPLEPQSPLSKLQTSSALPRSEPSEHRDVTAWTTARAIEYLPWIWLAGTPLTFVLLATGLIGAERLRRTSRIVTEGPVHDAGERLRAALGVGRSVTLAICDRLATPLMVGIVRPLILLPPAALTGWSADELEMVLLHELAHIRRWDNLVNLLQRVVESLLFFHPAVWLASRWVRLDREDCCDAVVVAHTAAPQAYAELLVALATPSQPLSHPLAGLALARHPLAGRIRRILRLEDETMLVSRNTLVAISTALLAVVLTVSCYNPRETEALEATERFTTEDTESTEKDDLFALQEPEASRVVPDPGARATSPFPTLEEQRAADVAYKLLGVELEKLNDEELKRVKALGYSGGLRVTAPGGRGLRSDRGGPLQNGDLLVGLHVWPTASLEQVSEILTRDDLDQLSPLKFYVIRRQPAENPSGEAYGGYGERGFRPRIDGEGIRSFEGRTYGGRERAYGEGMYGGEGGYGVGYGRSTAMVDQLVTGRISVDLEAWQVIRARAQPQPAPQLPGDAPLTPPRPLNQTLHDEPAANSRLPQELAQKYQQLAEEFRIQAKKQAEVASAEAKTFAERTRADVRNAQQQVKEFALQNQRVTEVLRSQAKRQAEVASAEARVLLEQTRAELIETRQALEIMKAELEKQRARARLEPDVLQPGDIVLLRVKGTLPDEPLHEDFRIESMGTLALGPTYGRVKIAGHNLLEAEKIVQEHLSAILAEPVVQLVLLMKDMQPPAPMPRAVIETPLEPVGPQSSASEPEDSP